MDNNLPKEKIIGKCIYCGDANTPLTDEHIVPYALDGSLILKSASCKQCSKITSLFERRVMRGVLSDYRYYRNFPSRSKYKDFVIERDYEVRMKNGEEKVIKLHLNQVGVHIIIPQFAEPKALYPKPEIKGIEVIGIHNFQAPPKKENLNSNIEEVKIKSKIQTSNLMRFLCKIALGFSLLSYDEGDFEIKVSNLILGNTDVEDWIYVGSPTQHSFSAEEKGCKLYVDNNYLCCDIKLFDDIQVVYKVVVGKHIRKTL